MGKINAHDFVDFEFFLEGKAENLVLGMAGNLVYDLLLRIHRVE